MSDIPGWVRDALSPARFKPYCTAAGNDIASAIKLYHWNVAVASAFHTPLHYLEVSLRNTAHRTLSRAFDRSDWWEAAPLHDNALRMLADAEKELRRRDHSTTSDDMVAQLSFGFWVSLLASGYDRTLWRSHLHVAFPGRPQRKRLHEDMRSMLLFRNRVMHYEPIHHRHLEADLATIHRLLGWMSEDVLRLVGEIDPVDAILANRPRFR
ncbi:hypothetical protein [Actinokineospora pegani]|uniref:hypothetical protein n=1 Tax=Actinokineospora pegani TaxID=2654637 RepID=UPI0012EA4D38|nr:hypothetical protein [Actinokineospora pegani]